MNEPLNTNFKEDMESLKEKVEKKISEIRTVQVAIREIKQMPMAIHSIISDHEIYQAFVEEYEKLKKIHPPEVIYRGKKLKNHETETLVSELRKRGFIVTIYELKNI